MSSHGASGGVSVRAGASPNLGGRRAGLRRAQRRAAVRQSRSKDDPETAALSCALVCGECGQLSWPQSGGALPHRRSADPAANDRAPCSHCGHDCWIDLARESTALALRHGEELAADALANRRSRVVGQLSVGTIVGAFIGVVAAGLTWPAAIVTVCTGAAAGLQAVRQSRLTPVVHRALPDRWSLVIPPAEVGKPTAHGEAHPQDELLTAPLSGERCAGYAIGLHASPDAGRELAGWALLEQRTCALRVGEASVDTDGAYLDLAPRCLGRLGEIDVEDAAVAYLRARGFSPTGNSLYAYEAVLAPHDPVALAAGTTKVLRRHGR